MKGRILISAIYLLICPLLNSCLTDEPLKLEYESFTPIALNDGWQLSNPEAENINRTKLEQAFKLVYDEQRFVMAKSLLVFRNGKLVAEAYPNNPEDIRKHNNIQSCTKSVTAMLLGVAIQQNLLTSLEGKLYDIYPSLFDTDLDKREITLSHALTMRSGIDFRNDKHTLKLYSTSKNSTEYVLSLDRKSMPGTAVQYNDGDPHLISKVIEMKSGKSLANFANEHVFEKLGISNWKWESAKDGTTFGAFSLFLTARDLGKIGQLLLQNGTWKNEQIVNASYLKSAVTHHVYGDLNNKPYGYYFWLYPQWNAYAALGHGGQFLFVVPDKNLVVVYTAWPYTGHDLADNGEALMSIIYNSCE
ncbi:MAG: serine hydrolase [Algoriphagus sp.]|uniref:serine hydrolase domain-containing protein n=1 Tax=Algoriphagus sp. TaxID=1872435 RepID=UPI002731ABC7|nr:serine hydrolase [Algoriphagus sp.]MDP2040353.1 serine hydrolase [Algoriphagus sp.]MDP3473844.1 serine hydrolase [Algoriphagus sp.]